MSSLSRELVFLILQFLDEEKLRETVHKLEQESGFFFNMKYFEDQVLAGEWEEVEKYLSGFTKVDDNRYSMKIFFEIRKQKYLEALDRQDRAKAVEILVKDLKVFASFNEDLYKEITQLLVLENFRENEQLSKYGDTKSARNIMLQELRKLIEANPLFREKLHFPPLKASRLRTLINQSLNWQHQLCKNPRPHPDIKTLFVDHACGPPPNGGRAGAPAPPNPLLAAVPKQGPFPLGAHALHSGGAALAGWMAGPAGAPAGHASVASQPGVPPAQSQDAWQGHAALMRKRPGTPPALSIPQQPALPPLEYAPAVGPPEAPAEHIAKRARPAEEPYGAAGPSHSIPPAPPPIPAAQPPLERTYNVDDLPRTVARTLSQGSSVMSMDFHPYHQTVLLVGTNTGDIALWEVNHGEKGVEKRFCIWDPPACSPALQALLSGKDTSVSVNKVAWSPDGQLLGAAFSKHVVHIYTYAGGSDLRQHFEIDAHVGGVNDLAFAHPNKQLCVVTCGDDKTIKVWDAASGRRLYVFEGHEAPVYSVCPHHKENIQFIFSTAIDGKIKAWLYDHMGSRVDYDAPGKWCTTMAYSDDGTRLFSCGTSKDGESSLVEWNESEGAIKHSYSGFRKRSFGVVQFDTIQNRFLVAGDEYLIKFWDMDQTVVLFTLDADGGLPASPRLRFNREGSLLAATTSNNEVKVLASPDGLRVLRAYDNAHAASQAVPPDVKVQVQVQVQGSAPGESSGAALVRAPAPVAAPVLSKEPMRTLSADVDKSWNVAEVTEMGQCRSQRLADSPGGMQNAGPAAPVPRLIYTNNGTAVLALGTNAVHKLWKWTRERAAARASASLPAQLWQPASGVVMANDIAPNTDLDETVHCIALSKNESYVMSASGGKVSLFNMITFKVMTTFMAPPPVATFLAFHPQDNNIIAIGMEDASIQLYNVRLDEVKSKLKGHTKRVTGLAFSSALGVLVSAGGDSQLCVWNTDGWERRKSKTVGPVAQRPAGTETRVHFLQNQQTLLVSQDMQLALYDVAKLERLQQWTPRDGGVLSAPITCAAVSCDSSSVFAGFADGSLCVFDCDKLRPRVRLLLSAFAGPSASVGVIPLSVAAHPQDPQQLAIGLSDGAVFVVEPLEGEGQWGGAAALENGTVAPVPPGPPIDTTGSR